MLFFLIQSFLKYKWTSVDLLPTLLNDGGFLANMACTSALPPDSPFPLCCIVGVVGDGGNKCVDESAADEKVEIKLDEEGELWYPCPYGLLLILFFCCCCIISRGQDLTKVMIKECGIRLAFATYVVVVVVNDVERIRMMRKLRPDSIVPPKIPAITPIL